MRRTLPVGLAVGLYLLAPPVRGDGDRPQPVSPGSAGSAEKIATSCPTFLWSGVDKASGYELAVYRLAEGGELRTELVIQVPGGATGWTPPAAQCPASGARHAWAVRAQSEDGLSQWSEALLFETAGRPSDDEVRQALLVLRRYQTSKRGEPVSDGIIVTPSEGVGNAKPSSGQESRHRGPRPPLVAPLHSNTVGASPPPRTVTPPTSFDLTLEGALDLGGYVFKDGVPFIHNDGGAAYLNTAVGLNALVSTTPGAPYSLSGSNNSAFGYDALGSNTTGSYNTANGAGALRLNTTGFANTASGTLALMSNKTGSNNTAVGVVALGLNTTGNHNTAVGKDALLSNTQGSYNTASGLLALEDNTHGSFNTASGSVALSSNTTGNHNTATGVHALGYNTTGFANTANGDYALRSNTTGWANTAIGSSAGYSWTTGRYNVALGVGAWGVAGESGVIRIGGSNLQTDTFIEGIRGATGASAFDEAVCTNSDEQLGPCSPSSLRFKQDVADMGSTVSLLGALRPVTFRFNLDEGKGGAGPPLQYGLIAEEVAKVLPTLVSYDEEGRPTTVRYSLLTPLLLNELQRQEAVLRRQDEELESLRDVEVDLQELRSQIADRDRQLADLRRRLEKLAKKKRFRDDP